MLNQEQRQLVKRFIDIFLRRKKIIIICIFIAITIGVGIYVQAPKIYRSSSLIMYQHKINPSDLSPDLGRFQETVSTVNQQITSRSSLEGMIMQFDLYRDERARLPMEDVVDKMRKSISVKPDRNGKIFEVSYTGSTPRKVLLITNALASKFIEENIRLREETVSETSSYIKDELNMAKGSLNKKEAAMRDYKLRYYNEMPEQLGSNISRLNALQTQYQGFQNNLQELERTKILIQEQISLRADLLLQIEGNAKGQLTSDQRAAELGTLHLQLENILTRYTDKHPDVKRLKSLIAKYEQDLAENKSETVAGTDSNGFKVQDPQTFKMQQQLETIEYTMSLIKSEKEETKKQIEKFKQLIEAAPVREAEWTDLTRDYNQLSKHYQGLVGRNILAGSAETLERRQKGSQFKIIDPAHYPENPYSPDFMKIMFMAIGIGLGTGVAISMGIEFLDTSFRDAHDLESFLDLPVACSIPVIRTKKEKRLQYLKFAIWLSLFIFSLTILGGGIAFLWYKGIIII